MQLVEPRPSRPIPIRITPLIDVVFILGKVQWQGQAMALDQLMNKLGNAGITEVNLATTGDTPLGAFTRVLSGLADQGIDSHWKRTNPTTP